MAARLRRRCSLMDILRDRKFVEVPGSRRHELPPLLVRTTPHVQRLDNVMELISSLIQRGDLKIPPPMATDPVLAKLELEQKQRDAAIHIIEQYQEFIQHWRWGNDVLEWVRQCETTFETRMDLRNLLRADIWPHAGRCSFVSLLEDKDIETGGVQIERAVGTRLVFHRPPPLKYFSAEFLLYLDPVVANNLYDTWAGLNEGSTASFPPERFDVQVIKTSLR